MACSSFTEELRELMQTRHFLFFLCCRLTQEGAKLTFTSDLESKINHLAFPFQREHNKSRGS